MNRYGPVGLIFAGILVTAAIGGGVTILDAEVPFTTQSGGAAAKQPTETSSPQLRATTTSAIVNDEDGNLVRIEAAVANPQDTAVEKVIALRVDGDRDGTFEMTAGKQSLTVSEGETVTLDFTIPTSRLGAGTYEYVVETADGSADLVTGSFALHAADFVVNGIHTQAVVRGDPAAVTATLSNVGDFPGTKSITIAIDRNQDGTYQAAEQVATEEVSIEDGGRLNVTLQIPTESIHPGHYPVRISTGSESREAKLLIKRPPTLSIQTVEESRNVVPGEPLELIVHVKNVGDVAGSQTISVSGLAGKANETRNVSLGAGDSTAITFGIDTVGLEAGYYQYQVTTPDDSVSFPARLKHPPSFRVSSVNAPMDVAQGTPMRVSVGVTNVGDLPGNRTVSLIGPSETNNRTVEIAARQTETLNFTVGTSSLSQGNYTYSVLADAPGERFEVRVRAPTFEVADLSGTGTYTVGDEPTFSAQLRNTGDAMGVQRVELRIDVDDDDTPEPVGIAKEVRLAPGERTTVTFTIDREQWDDAAPETSQIGSHIFGIYTNDTNVTGVFAVKPASGGSGGTADDSQDLASRDEIAQEKYGKFYSAVSEETQTQIDELYTRQPFAKGLVVTEVLTREEIARQQFGLDTEPGEPFHFTDLDIQVQQEVEAIFDAQFTSEQGDRIESWIELAKMKYGQPYDQLTAEQQETIRNAYLEQFDDTS